MSAANSGYLTMPTPIKFKNTLIVFQNNREYKNVKIT